MTTHPTRRPPLTLKQRSAAEDAVTVMAWSDRPGARPHLHRACLTLRGLVRCCGSYSQHRRSACRAVATAVGQSAAIKSPLTAPRRVAAQQPIIVARDQPPPAAHPASVASRQSFDGQFVGTDQLASASDYPRPSNDLGRATLRKTRRGIQTTAPPFYANCPTGK